MAGCGPPRKAHRWLSVAGKSAGSLLQGSGDLVSKVISALIGVRSIDTFFIPLVTKSNDPLSAVVSS